ncbi:spermidine dehydrogenase [Streptosporangium becharense]|uniref:Spermidine dehydrogenase n=1 Tax=Streptosporangium becharense TaxID=1816182 RepID=A0A7W9IH84_9ACTN|nr:NAD(P)-binding protein [Streptosporangium becharense]MBB2908894.1 spermidine dehydrogenase [Streptosporangium becharense]MBB5820088.1 spermidine dehydrogenase [Streptosporangium becharense]
MTDPREINPRKARELGMDRPISRRDFFDGVAVIAGIAALGSPAGCGGARAAVTGAPGADELQAPADLSYPPAFTGLRGDTAEAIGVPHALRDGRFWPYAGTPEATGERYDLVVVGAGISGVAAAHRWLERHPRARILILDNHDEVGGHARRNEFSPRGRTGPLVAYGGSRSIRNPSAWTPEGKDLLDKLGIRPRRLERYVDRRRYERLGMHDSVFCDRESFPAGSADRLVVLTPDARPRRWIAELPVAERARRDLVMLYEDPPDWFPRLSAEEKQERLARLTYSGFLRDVCGAHPDVLAFVRTLPVEEWGYGADALGAIDAWGGVDGRPYPGLQGLGLDRDKPSRYNSPTVIRNWGADEPRVHCFPEGNQAIVRMMLGRMIPGFATAVDAERITTAEFDYGTLDRPGNRVRVRLSSPVVSVANDGAPEGAPGRATGATVGYFDGDRVRTVQAGGVILACWNAMIPYLVDDLPPAQERALHRAVKVPVLHATVQLRDWRAWKELGIRRTRFTGAYWCVAELADPIDIGGYRSPGRPEEPITVHLTGSPVAPGMSPAHGSIAGRYALLKTPYAHLEYGIREQLARLLGPGGFDPVRDIEAITVNRWGHGYAPEYATPWDIDFYPDGPFPANAARRRHGRIAIANSDSVPSPRADAAITAAYRAVDDLQT